MRPSGFTDPAFAAIADLGYLLAGLVFPPNRQPSAEAGMRRAMATLRLSDPAALLRATEVPGETRDVVLAELTVGESYFFRDAAQLNLIATELLPALAASGSDRPLHVWSAGCASGEEPYTVAILMRELARFQGRILGTDVALPRLRAAKRGRYTRWALRGVSDDRIARWFRARGNYFDVDQGVRDAVEFRIHNLVHDSYPPAEGGGRYDLVLCRNVMIYFDLATAARVATGLLDSLAPDGWLVLGASDPPIAQLVPCDVVMTPAGIAYRRADRQGAGGARRLVLAERAIDHPRSAAEPPAVAVPESGVPAALAANAPEPGPAPADLAVPAVPAGPEAGAVDGTEGWIGRIRMAADQGRLSEAGVLCARALEIRPHDAELHYLHAVLLAEAGWHADGAVAARRSIYLDRRFVMGHLVLGDTLARTDDISGARIAFENAVALLAEADPGAPIAAADGVPVSRLRQIATLRLRELTGGTPR